MTTAWSKFTRPLRAFYAARGGNVATIFALTLIPIVGAAGAAIDFSRANAVKADLQGALDAAALMLSKEAATDSNNKLQRNALKYFKANFNKPEATNIAVSAVYSSSDSSVVVNGSAAIPTDFMQIFGYNQITINGSSTAKWGIDQLRVALVLDNTGSMAQAGKMDALKTATHSMLTLLQSASVTNGDIQVAIIPFANGVNVGVENVAEPWIDWSYYSNSGGAGWHGGGGHGGGGRGRGSGGSWSSGGSSNWSSGSGSWSSSSNSSGTWHGSGGSSCSWSSCWSGSGTWSGSSTGTSTSHWQGCVMDRDQDYDVLNTAPVTGNKSTLFPAIYSTTCPVAMMGLSYSWDDLNATVDTMTPTGTTNQTIGLAWGWLALTQGEPFDNSAMPARTQLAIVLLTDGLNTENRWSSDQATIDVRTQKACDNVKAANVTVYTVQVNTGSDPTSTLLQNCASDKSKFYLLTRSDQILGTFNDIGSQLAKLRIAK
jgi:Flp pilus assembly protein TadG